VANSLDKVNNTPKQDPFKEYIKDVEPSKREKSYVWQTAIGLQAVDGLEPSTYLRNTAIRNIEGEISFEEAAEMWGKSTDALRQACIARNGKPPRFHIGVEARQSKRIWLVTYEGMKRLYGEPVKE